MELFFVILGKKAVHFTPRGSRAAVPYIDRRSFGYGGAAGTSDRMPCSWYICNVVGRGYRQPCDKINNPRYILS